MAKAGSAITSRVFWLASLLFFISGGTGLAYQVIWFKRFSHVWGSTSLAFAAVGGSFLFGLGLGALLLGRLADRTRSPLRWYGVCELAIGLLAVAIPYEIAGLVNASVGIYSIMPEQPLPRFFVQFCITLLVVGPPCVLMGGTLPLLVRQLTRRDGSLDQATGWLYAINTFGAATGCYLTGFHLLPSLDLLWTNNLTAAVNIALGLISIAASRAPDAGVAGATVSDTTARVQPRAEGNAWSGGLPALWVATAFSGCGALILEMTWSRQLALILGGSTYAFTATLFVVLVGIALGSLVFHLLLRRWASSPIVPVAVVGLLMATTLLGKLTIPQLSQMLGMVDVSKQRGDQLGNAIVCVSTSCVLEFLPAVMMGILFPLFVHLTRETAARVGAAVGTIYAWNTLGSILGACLTAVVLFPSIGTTEALGLALSLYLVSAILVVPWRGTANVVMLAGAAAAGIGAIVVVARPIDPRLTNMGSYLYGDASTNPATKGTADWVGALTTMFFKEGASSNVFVSHGVHRDINLRVNGKVDASAAGDMVTQIGLAWFPRVFKPNAKEVLVIGFGSGCTSGRCLLFPETHVTCCEIEPAVYEAADQFAGVNYVPQRRTLEWLQKRNRELAPQLQVTAAQIDELAKFSIVFADGRTALQGSDKKYDMIISEPSNPWLAGVSNLFTKEFFHTAKEHLNDDGVLAQWIQTYSFTASDYAMIVRTLSSEFPYFGVVRLLGDADTVLLASKKPLLPDPAGIAALQKAVDHTPALAADLQTWFGGTDVRWVLLQQYELGQEQLEKLIKNDSSQEINTDLHLLLEFDAPLRLFRPLRADEAANVVLSQATSLQWRLSLAEKLGLDYESAAGHETAGRYLVGQLRNPLLRGPLANTGQLDRAAGEFLKAIELDPNLVAAHRGLAAVRRAQNKMDEVIAQLEIVTKLSPEDAVVRAELAQDYDHQKKFERAVELYREALRLKPEMSEKLGNYIWANNLAWILATNPDPRLRNGKEALSLAKQIGDLTKYQQPALLDALAVSYAELGQFDEAIKVAELMLSLANNNPQLVEQTKGRIKLFQLSQPFRSQ